MPFCLIRDFGYALQFVRHLIRQAVEVIISEKEKKRIPTIIAPITLVAANPTAKRITAETIVPRMPRSRPDVETQALLQETPWDKAADINVTARYRTAMPKETIEKIAVRVITPVI